MVNKFSERIQKRARELNLEERKFLARCVEYGITEQTASYWWDGKIDFDKPTKRVRQALAKALDMPVEKLFKE